MAECLLFKTFLKQNKRNFNEYAYDHDIQYRATVFRQFSLKYRMYVDSHELANDYIMVAYEIHEYEKRIRNYRES